MLKNRFSTREVLALTGTTARQLQWWDEKRVVVPAREGRKRVYTGADLIEILTIEELRRRRISLLQVRRILRHLRVELQSRLSDLVEGRHDHHLLLDGRKVYLETDTNQIIDLIRKTHQPVFLICLSDVVRRLRANGVHSIESKIGASKKAAKGLTVAAIQKEVS